MGSDSRDRHGLGVEWLEAHDCFVIAEFKEEETTTYEVGRDYKT